MTLSDLGSRTDNHDGHEDYMTGQRSSKHMYGWEEHLRKATAEASAL